MNPESKGDVVPKIVPSRIEKNGGIILHSLNHGHGYYTQNILYFVFIYFPEARNVVGIFQL